MGLTTAIFDNLQTSKSFLNESQMSKQVPMTAYHLNLKWRKLMEGFLESARTGVEVRLADDT